jgi:hypothetical protein
VRGHGDRYDKRLRAARSSIHLLVYAGVD